jgi:hypothetical protein
MGLVGAYWKIEVIFLPGMDFDTVVPLRDQLAAAGRISLVGKAPVQQIISRSAKWNIMGKARITPSEREVRKMIRRGNSGSTVDSE